jgi:acyl-CoA reductase-like NAD-dependent aldehyde dehydrogenase
MTSHEQFQLVDELVQDAVANGATLRCGGPVRPAGLPDADFYAPTVLTDVTHDMRIMREEIFGPVVPVIAVDSDDEAIALSNDSDFGLGASVWTADRETGREIARRLDDGTVWINDHLFSHGACSCSWGGTKDSGIGRSHSKFGFYECVSIKTEVSEIGLTRNPWWHPYDRTLGTAMQSTAKLLYGSGDDRREALRTGKRALATLSTRLVRRG